jgi:hypothetical protein
VRRSGIAPRAFQGARETGQPLEAVGTGAQPDCLGGAPALVGGDLARAWTKRRRRRGPSSRKGPVLQRTKEDQQMETVELSQQQSARLAELPEDDRVVGVERRTLAACQRPNN